MLADNDFSCIFVPVQTTTKRLTKMKASNKIINKKELAVLLSYGPVNIEFISKKLEKIIAIWLARKEVFIENGFLVLS